MDAEIQRAIDRAVKQVRDEMAISPMSRRAD